jgi:hypothetical protein
MTARLEDATESRRRYCMRGSRVVATTYASSRARSAFARSTRTFTRSAYIDYAVERVRPVKRFSSVHGAAGELLDRGDRGA